MYLPDSKHFKKRKLDSNKFTIPRVPGKEALLRNKKDKHEAPRTAELKFKLRLESEWRAEKRKGEKE